MYVGIILGIKLMHDDCIKGKEYGLVIAIYLILHIIRFVTIFIFWPILRAIGYNLTISHILLCTFSGIKGTVGIALAIVMASDKKIQIYPQDIIFFHIIGIALLNRLINVPLTRFFILKL